MTWQEQLLLWLAVAVLVLLIFLVLALARMAALRTRLAAADHAKRSQSTRYGQITEQFAPWMQGWPWDPKGFRFIGTPVDGVQFNDDGIVLVEIKSSRSRLSPVQRRIREHVAAGRVTWKEVRID